jgi:hypothetical protein
VGANAKQLHEQNNQANKNAACSNTDGVFVSTVEPATKQQA